MRDMHCGSFSLGAKEWIIRTFYAARGCHEHTVRTIVHRAKQDSLLGAVSYFNEESSKRPSRADEGQTLTKSEPVVVIMVKGGDGTTVRRNVPFGVRES